MKKRLKVKSDTIEKVYARYFEQAESRDQKSGAPHPHCDDRILHFPGQCWACDLHPQRQLLRKELGIGFTGDKTPTQWPCPAEMARSEKSLNHWYGNVARTKEEADEDHRIYTEELDRLMKNFPGDISDA